MKCKSYTSEQLRDADRLASALASVHGDNRLMFKLALDAMATGAELAEQQLRQSQNDDPAA